jgi:hypothetical protein
MACFIVPAVEAVAVTVAAQAVKKQEAKQTHAEAVIARSQSVAWSRKLRWLSWLLWGGVLLLAFEHVWHGEVVPFFPFLTAMNDPGETVEMLHEMSTVGVTMAVIVTVVWGVICFAADTILRRSEEAVQ